MHFMVSFEIDAPTDRQSSIQDALRACFAEHPHIEAVRQAYVVQVMGYGVYEDVQKRLLETARQLPDAVVRFVMTPLLHRGLYHGRLRAEAAEAINRLTD
jgi:hypothetical protein